MAKAHVFEFLKPNPRLHIYFCSMTSVSSQWLVSKQGWETLMSRRQNASKYSACGCIFRQSSVDPSRVICSVGQVLATICQQHQQINKSKTKKGKITRLPRLIQFHSIHSLGPLGLLCVVCRICT